MCFNMYVKCVFYMFFICEDMYVKYMFNICKIYVVYVVVICILNIILCLFFFIEYDYC